MIQRYALAVVLSLTALAGCSDPVDPPHPGVAAAASALTQAVPAGSLVPEPPSVRVTTSGGRPLSGVRVSFTVESGGGTLTGSTPVTDADGDARVESWVLGTTPGRNTVRATVEGVDGADVLFEAIALPTDCTGLVTLDMAPGTFVRLKDSGATTYPCLLLDGHQPAGSEYLLLFENMSLTGPFNAALFAGPPRDTVLAFTLSAMPLGGPAAARTSAVRLPAPDRVEPGEAASWDFGAGRIREHIPEPPPADFAGAALIRGNRVLELNSVAADPAVGDTIQVLMEGIPRLGINTGMQKAVIRLVTNDLIIAEDVRLTTTLRREGGGFNTPLTETDLAAIAAEYTAVARVQGDLFFENRYNSAVESSVPNRVTAVHSLMPADDVWGYTYSVTGYFVWDYWVATNGSTAGLNQHPQRVTDNLFMHEISHMRHMGMIGRSGQGFGARGNRWLVEGFARFTERLPIAARILGVTNPSRTDNIVLPRNPAFGNAYFLDDVPTYLNAGSSFFFGYQSSSWIFDYFADQVALRGGDVLPALREFLLAGASRSALDGVVQRWLPGTSFADLVTQARIALYADDIGTATLPPWTQYHQFRLRESRPAPPQFASQDPRTQWIRFSPAGTVSVSGRVPAGAATGFLLDGDDGVAAVMRVDAPSASHATLSITRIR